MKKEDLTRFEEMQRKAFPAALDEIRNGKKETHWMWYIFPQMKGLGFSETAKYYGIRDLEEAASFLKDPYLGENLKTISAALLELPGSDPIAVFGETDAMKLRSSMTLFALADPKDPVFPRVLEKYFRGQQDPHTLDLLGKLSNGM